MNTQSQTNTLKWLSDPQAPQESLRFRVNVSAVSSYLFCWFCRRGHVCLLGPFGLLGSPRPRPQQLHVALGQSHHAESKSEGCRWPLWLPSSPSDMCYGYNPRVVSHTRRPLTSGQDFNRKSFLICSSKVMFAI